MPELPEVETIKNELLPHLAGRRFTQVIIRDSKLVRQPPVEEFRQRLNSQRVAGLERRGKYLIFRLSTGDRLIAHLKMSGSLLLNGSPTDRHSRVIFQFDDGTSLVFNDRRRLGALWLVDSEAAVTGKLGPEPLAPDFTPEAMFARLQKHRSPVKAVLLDQTFVAGIGNMYADEALFAAGIHPLRNASSLSLEETGRLYRAIRDVLTLGIESKGASVNTYKRPDGSPGTAHTSFKVAHKGGKPCPVCGTLLQRLAIRNRGSYFCPNCQRL